MTQKIRKIKVGITGAIGSGKSEFSKILENNGFNVINVDNVSKDILSTDKEIQKQIIKTFGKDSFINGQINKNYLAEKVFSNPENVVKINSIVHPKVIVKVNDLITEYLKRNNIAFAEAALIYEADMEDMFDYVVLVTSDENLRLKRKVKISKMSEDDFKKRNDNQIKDEEKKKRADFVFENNGSIEDLKNKTEFFIKILNGLLLKDV